MWAGYSGDDAKPRAVGREIERNIHEKVACNLRVEILNTLEL